uniref:NADH-ubiquinone oxidoreductase chain 6 n=1 Tax=Eremias brenchleyi TaxID=326972 RepID=B7S727_9SAUR|nr:NADH dehydrogenase subunit 6 [Eremias brenchleyi]ABO64383.1 NADH dehydrogenase subunit 6 [Eremias brenchleyi]
MMYFVCFLGLCFMVGLVGVVSNPSTNYGAGSLVFAAGAGCGMLVMWGCSFDSPILLLIYLGGMLVVFAYSVALASDLFPETLDDFGAYFGGYVLLILLLGVVYSEVGLIGLGMSGVDSFGLSIIRMDLSGVSLLYHLGGVGLLICGWALLLTLFVVLELTRGMVRGGLRAV